MQYTVDGLVLREVNVGENDKMLTLLTPDKGRIGVMAKGTRSVKSKVLATAQLYTYGNYEIYEKGDFKWLRGGSVIEGFYGIRDDIEKLSLAAYIADVACELSGEDESATDILRMTLNTFFAISKKIRPLSQIKGVFELRAAAYAGFMPELAGCKYCKRGDIEGLYLDVMNGCVLCSECINKRAQKRAPEKRSAYDDLDSEMNILVPISPSVLAAMNYAVLSLPERMFSFSLDGKDENDMFARAAEEYLLNHLERGFTTLDFYKSMI